LDCSSGDIATAAALLAQIPEARLEPYVVSGAVGNVRNNGPELIDPVPTDAVPMDALPIDVVPIDAVPMDRADSVDAPRQLEL
ncbi:MAG: putative response-associated peptidase, partial [Pseudonocardiales bacterium]|nr:putative response-associated peptidase [Pseudonocardiales bacterium]